MVSRIIAVSMSILVAFGMSLLLIPTGGIVIGLSNKHIIHPAYERYVKQPLYVNDLRCCR